MKRCPQCNRTYTDDALSFCLDDGSPLVSAAAPSSFDPSATVQYPQARDTSPPPTIAYPGAQSAPPVQPPPTPPPAWSPMPPVAPQKRSVWPWLLGIGAVLIGSAFSEASRLVLHSGAWRFDRFRGSAPALLAHALVFAALPVYVSTRSLDELTSLRFLGAPRPNVFRNSTVFDYTESYQLAEFFKVRTTPFTCGCQASVAIKIRMRGNLRVGLILG